MIIDIKGNGGGGSYTLPTASEDTLGGVKIGSGITIDSDGKISAQGGGEGGGIPIVLELPENPNNGDVVNFIRYIDKSFQWNDTSLSTRKIDNYMSIEENISIEEDVLIWQGEWYGSRPRLYLMTDNNVEIRSFKDDVETTITNVPFGTIGTASIGNNNNLTVDLSNPRRIGFKSSTTIANEAWNGFECEVEKHQFLEYTNIHSWSKVLCDVGNADYVLKTNWIGPQFDGTKKILTYTPTYGDTTPYDFYPNYSDDTIEIYKGGEKVFTLSNGLSTTIGTSIAASTVNFSNNLLIFASNYGYNNKTLDNSIVVDGWVYFDDESKATACDINADYGIPYWDKDGVIFKKYKALNISSIQLNNSDYGGKTNIYSEGSANLRIYAPTAEGISGQILKSAGKNGVPVFADFKSFMGGLKVEFLTEDEYEALETKDNETLYVIKNDD